jgi:hypothetical protein
MKKIGVITFHNGPNFGGYMQAWHIVHAIRKLGHECQAVNYLHDVHYQANKIRIPLKSIAALKGRVFWALKNRPFRGIGDTLCDHPFTTDADMVPWDEYDGYVVGSDIVWDYQDANFGHDPVYFGMHSGQLENPIVAYAASCGPADPSGPFPDYVSKGLAKFKAIGVRDQATANLVQNASRRESTIVVDPTWLNTDPDIDWSRRPRDKYVFVYGSKVDEKLGLALRAYCDKRNLKLISALTSCKWADHTYRSLHPFQWVDLFKHAESTAILGTLHGTLFSIKYGKPFILVTGDRIKPKLTNVLANTQQEFRIFEPGNVGEKELLLLDEGNTQCPEIPEQWLSESLQFMGDSLDWS